MRPCLGRRRLRLKIGRVEMSGRATTGGKATRLAQMGLFIALSGCASVPAQNASPVSTALVLWPRPIIGECDFENPSRDSAWVVATSRDRLPAKTPRSYRYVVRNAQLQFRPDDTELCVAIVRHEAFGQTFAAYGFHLRALDPEHLQIEPVYARLARASVGPASANGVTNVQIGFIAARLGGNGAPGPSSEGIVRLAPLRSGEEGRRVSAAPFVVRWPVAGSTPDILRLAVVISEDVGADGGVTSEELHRTLGELERWDPQNQRTTRRP